MKYSHYSIITHMVEGSVSVSLFDATNTLLVSCTFLSLDAAYEYIQELRDIGQLDDC